MSDMSRAAPPPSPHAHQQHDPLLVAQVAAGDALDPARAAEARTWLATCPACAALAADLSRVSVAVRQEPVPPRRRDFRLTPEQAEELQGNPITRLLRRLSLPRSRAFGPAAAGVMSVGLVFVVAGYAWPDGRTLTGGPDAEPVPAALQFEAAPSAGLGADSFLASPEEAQALSDERVPAAAPDAAQKALRAKPAEAPEEAADLAQGLSNVADDSAAASEADTSAADVMRAGAAAATADEPEAAAGESEALATGGELSASTVERGEARTAVVSDGEGSTSALEQDEGLQRWLILVGVILALGGGGLLLLALVSRRSADPLLR